jgi:hypothetical protein
MGRKSLDYPNLLDVILFKIVGAGRTKKKSHILQNTTLTGIPCCAGFRVVRAPIAH